MAFKSYHTVNGRIRGETGPQGRRDYLTDALGSVTATVDQSAAIEGTYRYKPYGKRIAKTGSGADPRFLHAGDTGSRTTGAAHAEQYNRARHYDGETGRWTSVDPLWPDEQAYAYVMGNPVRWTDGSGTSISYHECLNQTCRGEHIVEGPPRLGPMIKRICNHIGIAHEFPSGRRDMIECIRKCGYDHPKEMYSCLANMCSSNSRKAHIQCHNGWWCRGEGTCANTSPWKKPCMIDLCVETKYQICKKPDPCTEYPKAVVAIREEFRCGALFPVELTIIHEMTHCCGLGIDGLPFTGNAGIGDCIASCYVFGV